MTQNVNQQLANPVGMTALTALAPMPGAVVSNLTEAPASPSKTETPGLTVATIGPLMNNPLRLREAFLVNELLQPPLALRKRHNPRL